MDSTLIPKRHAAVTPSDSASIGPTLGLYVGGAGNLTAVDAKGNSALYICQAGTTLSGEFSQVLATGTTATGIVALYAN